MPLISASRRVAEGTLECAAPERRRTFAPPRIPATAAGYPAYRGSLLRGSQRLAPQALCVSTARVPMATLPRTSVARGGGDVPSPSRCDLVAVMSPWGSAVSATDRRSAAWQCRRPTVGQQHASRGMRRRFAPAPREAARSAPSPGRGAHDRWRSTQPADPGQARRTMRLNLDTDRIADRLIDLVDGRATPGPMHKQRSSPAEAARRLARATSATWT